MTSGLRAARVVGLFFIASSVGSLFWEDVPDKSGVHAVTVSNSPKKNVLPTRGGSFRFADITDKAGIHAMIVSGSPMKNSLLEVNGRGACWHGYNNDGYMDPYLVNRATLERPEGTAVN